MSERDPLRVGLVTLAALALVAAGVLYLSVTNFGTRSYTAVLEHTAGLRSGEDVQVHGVVVGEVTGIELAGEQVVVTFALDEDIDLGDRSTAAVKVATLLGTHYLEVDPVGAGALADATIPLERTSVPYNLQDVLEQGTSALEELDPELLAEALTAMASTLGASQEEIGPALQGVARLSEVVAQRSDQIGELLTSGRLVADQLSASTGDIVGLMEQANLVIGEVTARREAIHRLLLETTELSTALTAIATSTRGKLTPALEDINSVLDALNAQDKQLSHVLEVMAPSVRYLANATGSGPFLPLVIDAPGLLADDVSCKTAGTC